MCVYFEIGLLERTFNKTTLFVEGYVIRFASATGGQARTRHSARVRRVHLLFGSSICHLEWKGLKGSILNGSGIFQQIKYFPFRILCAEIPTHFQDPRKRGDGALFPVQKSFCLIFPDFPPIDGYFIFQMFLTALKQNFGRIFWVNIELQPKN